jgi:hypothetical protein
VKNTELSTIRKFTYSLETYKNIAVIIKNKRIKILLRGVKTLEKDLLDKLKFKINKVNAKINANEG